MNNPEKLATLGTQKQ